MADAIIARLRDRDARRALAALEAIAAEREPDAFVQRALDRLAALVGSELTTLSLCDLERQTRTVVARPGEALSDGDRAIFDRHFTEHPLVRYHRAHPGGRTRRITDCIGLRAFRGSALFADYYRRIGIGHAMALPLRIDAATVVSVVFNRSAANFADADRAVADLLRSPLAALYRSVVAREATRRAQASLQGIAARAGWHTARLGEGGRLLDLSAGAAAMLRSFFPDAPAGEAGPAPAALRQWLRPRRMSWGLDWFPGDNDAPCVIDRAGWRLTVHFVADALAPERGELVMRRERVAMAPAELVDLPLTRREREVLAILAVGKTNGEIATLLRISPRTVQKHLEHIFDKLGVETRMAAGLRALDAAGPSRDES